MATFEEIQNAIQQIAGDISADVVDDMARAIVALDGEATKETRVVVASEKR